MIRWLLLIPFALLIATGASSLFFLLATLVDPGELHVSLLVLGLAGAPAGLVFRAGYPAGAHPCGCDIVAACSQLKSETEKLRARLMAEQGIGAEGVYASCRSCSRDRIV